MHCRIDISAVARNHQVAVAACHFELSRVMSWTRGEWSRSACTEPGAEIPLLVARGPERRSGVSEPCDDLLPSRSQAPGAGFSPLDPCRHGASASPFPTSWCATRKKATSIIGPGPAVARTTRHRPVARRGRYVVDVDSDFDSSEWCHFLLLLPVPI